MIKFQIVKRVGLARQKGSIKFDLDDIIIPSEIVMLDDMSYIKLFDLPLETFIGDASEEEIDTFLDVVADKNLLK